MKKNVMVLAMVASVFAGVNAQANGAGPNCNAQVTKAVTAFAAATWDEVSVEGIRPTGRTRRMFGSTLVQAVEVRTIDGGHDEGIYEALVNANCMVYGVMITKPFTP